MRTRERKYLPVRALPPGAHERLPRVPSRHKRESSFFHSFFAPITQIRAGVFQNGAIDRARTEIVIRMRCL